MRSYTTEKLKMERKFLAVMLKPQVNLIVNSTLSEISKKLFHTSSALSKVTSGKIKITPKKNRPVTYDESLPPPQIGHKKSWNSWNTSTIEGGHRHSETTTDDLFIRKFLYGTFPNSLLSKVIIKRQYNIIRIAAVMKYITPPTRMCFLIGFTEQLLSYWFQCNVKLEIQVLSNSKDIIFKHV